MLFIFCFLNFFGNSYTRRTKKNKKDQNIYLVFWDFRQVFICSCLYLLIVPKDGEKYIKKKEKNAFLCT
jgi:hypothetical protein